MLVHAFTTVNHTGAWTLGDIAPSSEIKNPFLPVTIAPKWHCELEKHGYSKCEEQCRTCFLKEQK